MINTNKQRDTDRGRETDTLADTERHDREGETETVDVARPTETGRVTHTERDRQTDRQTDRLTDKQINKKRRVCRVGVRYRI